MDGKPPILSISARRSRLRIEGAVLDRQARLAKQLQSSLEGFGDGRLDVVEETSPRHDEPGPHLRREARVRRARKDGIGDRAIGDGAGDGPDRIECAGEREGARGRHASGRGLESHRSREGGGNADRAARVAADRDLSHAVDHRDDRAGGRASRRAAAIARVAGDRSVRIGAERREGEFGHLRLADDDRAGRPQALDDGRVGCGRRLAAQHDGAGPRRLAGDVEEVFDRDDASVQRTQRPAGRKAGVGGFGFSPRRGLVQRREHLAALELGVPDAGQRVVETQCDGGAGRFRHLFTPCFLKIWRPGCAARGNPFGRPRDTTARTVKTDLSFRRGGGASKRRPCPHDTTGSTSMS